MQRTFKYLSPVMVCLLHKMIKRAKDKGQMINGLFALFCML